MSSYCNCSDIMLVEGEIHVHIANISILKAMHSSILEILILQIKHCRGDLWLPAL